MNPFLKSLLEEFGPAPKKPTPAQKIESAKAEAAIESLLWRAVGRSIVIKHQTCRCCHRHISSVEGQYLKLQHRRDKTAFRSVMKWRLPFSEQLPLSLQEFEEEIDYCYGCLLEERIAEVASDGQKQFSLFSAA